MANRRKNEPEQQAAPARTPVDETTVRAQSWAGDLGKKAIHAIAVEGLLSQEDFLNHEFPYSTTPYSAWNELRKKQYELRIELGRLDQKEPMSPGDVEHQLRVGGLLFEGDRPFVSLGCGHAPKGKYLRLVGGGIWFEDIASKYPSTVEMKAYGGIFYRSMSKTEKRYGIYRKVGWNDWEFDLDLTRQICVIDYGTLDTMVEAFGCALRRPSLYYRKERVTCSHKSKCCDLTGNYIPADFPYITMEENPFFGSHVSIAAFFDQIRLLTGYADQTNSATKLLTDAGFTDEMWKLLRAEGSYVYSSHVRWSDVHPFEQY
jgi:hypothetical protein